MRRPLAIMVLAAGTFVPAAGAVAAPSQVQPGGVGIRLAEAPKDRSDDPRARLYIVDHLHSGAVISRKVEISNTTDRPMTVSLYAAGATVSDGQFRFGEGRIANELTSWTTVEPGQVVVPPKSPMTATVQIRVPGNASAGERYGVIWAELPPSSGGPVTSINRVGVRMYLSVGSGSEPATDFSIDSLTARRSATNEPMVTAEVRNTGSRAIDVTGELKLGNGPAGLTAGPFPAKLGTTLGPGQSQPVQIPLGRQIPDGPWDATLTLRSGLEERSVSARITFPVAASEQGAPVTVHTEDSRLKPTLLVLATAAIVVVALAAVMVPRWRRPSFPSQPSHP